MSLQIETIRRPSQISEYVVKQPSREILVPGLKATGELKGDELISALIQYTERPQKEDYHVDLGHVIVAESRINQHNFENYFRREGKPKYIVDFSKTASAEAADK